MSKLARLTGAALALGVISACETEISGLAPAPDTAGPRVVFDLLARPLPEIPFPNDIATRLDLDSPTGRRVNASIMAPTILEKEVREEFNLIDGWGTFSPITVSFEAPIDPLAVKAAHFDEDWSNDAVYLIDLKTGEPVRLDLGRGNFPVLVQDTAKYFEGDQRSKSSNLLFESYAEACDTPWGPVAPEQDTDADGVCDRPNTADPTKPLLGLDRPDERAATAQERGNHVYRDLLDFYERESNTLIVRPLVAMKPRSEYAVVLTKRLRGEDGEAIRSPFGFINHVSQNDQLRPLLGHLGQGRLEGLTLDDVVFAWSFTTQSTTTDLEAIRAGLYGEGALGWLGAQVPDRLEPVRYMASRLGDVEERPVHPLNTFDDGNPYIARFEKFEPVLRQLGPQLGVQEGPDLDALMESYKFVDYFVIGSFRTANFLDDPEKPTFDAVFRVNPEEGKARVWKRPEAWSKIEEEAIVASVLDPLSPETALLRQRAKAASRDRVWFMLVVPKAINGHKAPFPVSIYGHGYTSARIEMLGFAGNLAKFGIASVGIDSYGHGLDLSAAERTVIEGVISGNGFQPLAESIFKSRARDLDNDTLDNSGGDFWVADTFHTRDVVRQSIVDWMQLIRVFHAFGTYEMGDLNGDGLPELAGDFNGDGVPDVAGPEYPTQGWWAKAGGRPGERNPGHDFFAWGQSLGGILGGILPAIEPAVAAAAPVAGGAGLSDIGIRSEQGGVIEAVFMEIFGPIFYAQKAEHGVHLMVQVQNVNDDQKIRLTETPLDIRPGDVVRAWNLHTDDGEPRKEDWAIVGEDLRFRLQVAADNAAFSDGAPVWQTDSRGHPLLDESGAPLPLEPVRVGQCEPEEVLEKERARTGMLHPADCLVFSVERGGQEVLRLDTFQRDVVFQGRRFAKDTRLVALARGFAMKRGTKTFRRFMSLAQTILEPGDPANYARHYFLDPLPARAENPAAVLVIATAGDLNVPVNTAFAQGRIAGVLPYELDGQQHAPWGLSPNDVLIRSKAMEAIEKLRYYQPVAEHAQAASEAEKKAIYDALSAEDQTLVDLVDCSEGACGQTTLVDVTHYSEQDGVFHDRDNAVNRTRYQGAPRLKHSLQEAMIASYPGRDAHGEEATRHSAMLVPWLDAHGKHGFDTPHPTDSFDTNLFLINLIGRYFQSRGTDLRFDHCMHRDGYDRPRIDVRKEIEGGSGPVPNPRYRQRDPDAARVAEPGNDCSFLPPPPESL